MTFASNPELTAATCLFEDYDKERYGKPWGAKVSLKGKWLDYDFKESKRDGLKVTVSCITGDIVAFGQKDFFWANNKNQLLIMEEDGALRKLTKQEAKLLLKDPIPEGYLADEEDFADV